MPRELLYDDACAKGKGGPDVTRPDRADRRAHPNLQLCLCNPCRVERQLWRGLFSQGSAANSARRNPGLAYATLFRVERRNDGGGWVPLSQGGGAKDRALPWAIVLPPLAGLLN